jgi:choline-sulfatase
MTERPDVLFLVLDSARKDRLSLYDHDRETTPYLERLAETATVYENAHVPAPWTLPSHCSMFTGKYPSEHGVTNGFADRRPVLPADETTLPERLSEAGYRTAGFSNNPWVGQLSGLDRGFDEYVEWDLEIGRTSGADIHDRRERLYSRAHSALGQAARQPVFALKRRFFTDSLVSRARRWVARGGTTPTFTFLNLMEAHSPYFPPRDAFEELGLSRPGPVEPRLLNTRLLTYVMGKTDLDGSDRRRVMEYYDASVRYEDGKVEELLEPYRERGDFDDMLLVVCSDHGKTLGDYPRDGDPPHYIRDINTNVPLLVKRPGQTSGRRVEDPVELTDLFGLVSSAVGGDASTSMQREHALTEDFVPHTGTEQSETTRWRVLSTPDHKYARSDAGTEYVFERHPNPVDERLLDGPEGGTDRPTTAELARALDERVSSLRTADAGESESEEIEGAVQSQLRDLGYL